MNKIKKFLSNPKSILLHWNAQGYFNKLPDKLVLKLIWFGAFGKRLNLKSPKTFNEKLQWLKLYDRKPIYTTMVDKYAVKKYVADKIGEQYIANTLGVWDKFEDIDFDKLPNQFVLKCNHDSCGLVICRDKSTFDTVAAKKKISSSLKRNYYYGSREWPYKNVRPKIIAEQYLGDNIEEYKLFCFNGVAKIILVCKGPAHSDGRTNDYCDIELNRLPFTVWNPNSTGRLNKPKELTEMITLAEKLSQNIPQVRVDMYLVHGRIYFGEFTFYHNAGYRMFDPEEWDYKLGNYIHLPK